ncbi:MAG TPA: zinc-ribbon domain-containing protein [Polyangiaceae bacterium]|nr:zinc-ribbon domain-containing protein [Polyangiaceae bacterium]
MKVSCQACGAKYTIADDKVRGRKVKIRCKSCGTPMVVDGQSEAPPAEAAPAGGAAGEAAGSATSWSVNLSDTDQRTMTTDEIVAAWKRGEVTNDAFVWKDGMGDWVPILDSPELKPLLTSAPATGAGAPTPFGPTVVTSSPTASARLAGGGRGAAVDLFDAAGGSGPDEDEVATSAPALPTAGSTAYDDGKMTGARNENSVLFSLDALKGGIAAEPRKAPPPARKTGAAVAAGDPFAMSPSEIGGPNPLFSLNTNQALLTAPAPPEPPPPRVTASGAAVAQPMNKLVVYGGGGAAAVILLLLGLLLGRGTGSKDAAAPDSSGKEQAAASTSAESDKKSDAKPDDTKTEQEKPADSASATETSSAKPASSGAASAAPATTAATAKVASTSSTTKSSSSSSGSSSKEAKEKAAKAAEETMPNQGSAPFSVSAAQVALTQAATNAGSCAKAAGPTGSGKVQVTFATSGRVTTATVMGPPFAGTSIGGCVAGVFRKARVPAYAGNPVTVSKSFRIGG